MTAYHMKPSLHVWPPKLNNRSSQRQKSINVACLLLGLILAAGNPCARAQTGPGSALSLSNAAYGMVASNASLTLSNRFTFEAWINPRAKVCNSIISRGHGGTAETDYNFLVGWNGSSCGTQMKLGLYAGGWHYSAAEISTNVWTHVAAAYDGTNVSFYINGVLDSTSPQTGSVYQSGSPLFIGRQGLECNCNFFQGGIDEVRIWRAARTANEIAANRSQVLAGTETNLVAYYRFDAGSGSVAANSAILGAINNLSLSNGPTWTSSGARFKPDVVLASSSGANNSTAILEGNVNPGNLGTTVYFEWGDSGGYGNFSGTTNVLSTNGVFRVRLPVTVSPPPGLWYYRMVAQNSAGKSETGYSFFQVTQFTDSATNISANSATLNGVVNPQAQSTQAYFEWGATTNYGNFTATNTVAAGNVEVPQSRVVSNLTPSTSYHFRLVSSNSTGTKYGNDVVFMTLTPAAGTWTPLANPPPGAVGPTILLSDGSVLAQNANGYASKHWFRLTPDAHGNYANGTWSPVPSMQYDRQIFGSTVLRDGRLLIAGGEYGSGPNNAEIYDPVSNAWTPAADPASDSHLIYDASTALLPDGRVLVGIVKPLPVDAPSNGYAMLYDAVLDKWERSGYYANGLYTPWESSWVELADDSILQVDPVGRKTQRYIPALNQWIPDTDVPLDLWSQSELGAALLLPNGKAFCLGGSGHTAIYTPSGSTNAGTWTAGADTPNASGALDAPAAMMVNGKILCAVSRISSIYVPPTTFYEYDYVNDSFALINAPGGGTEDYTWGSSGNVFLDLPDGSVLYSKYQTNLYVYRSLGAPLPAGKPTVLSLTTNFDGSLHLVGTLFNGISAGAAYGDDLQNDSNWPVVRFTDTNGIVRYGRTYNWSSTGVQTGTNLVSTECAIPPGASTDDLIEVVANGIASDPVSTASIVSSTNDSGPGSLRQIVATHLVSAATVTFAPTLAGQTLKLTGGQIALPRDVTIQGPMSGGQGIGVDGNAAGGIFYVPAGVSASMAFLTISNGSIYGIINDGSLSLNNCTLAHNSAPDGYGAILNQGNLQLRNCTLADNHGTYAGGVWNGPTSLLQLLNCTVVSNSAFGQGSCGGILNRFGGAVTLNNTIVSDNLGVVPNVRGPYDGNNNLVDANDIGLAPLSDYGGPTLTLSPLPGSPAVDTGSDTAAAGIPSDQRGGPRISGDHVDIGAVELQLVTSPNPVEISNTARLPDGSVQLAFTSAQQTSFRVFATTNLNQPFLDWPMIGFAAETPALSGQFQFTDLQATNYTERYYRVRSP